SRECDNGPRVEPPGVECLPFLPRRAAIAGVLFFLSGSAALVYQVVWQRILALQSGVGIHSIAIIVAAFMVGLGLGSHAGGLVSERRTARGALVAFALVEIGGGALLRPPVAPPLRAFPSVLPGGRGAVRVPHAADVPHGHVPAAPGARHRVGRAAGGAHDGAPRRPPTRPGRG